MCVWCVLSSLTRVRSARALRCAHTPLRAPGRHEAQRTGTGSSAPSSRPSPPSHSAPESVQPATSTPPSQSSRHASSYPHRRCHSAKCVVRAHRFAGARSGIADNKTPIISAPKPSHDDTHTHHSYESLSLFLSDTGKQPRATHKPPTPQ